MIIDQTLLDKLTAEAKASARLRMNYDLRNSASDGAQRMLNALEPGTVMGIHGDRGCGRGKLLIPGQPENDIK